MVMIDDDDYGDDGSIMQWILPPPYNSLPQDDCMLVFLGYLSLNPKP